MEENTLKTTMLIYISKSNDIDIDHEKSFMY